MEEAIQKLDPKTPEEPQMKQLEAQKEAGFKKTIEPLLKELKGYAMTPEELVQLDHLMKSDKLRDFSIDVETDATVRIDQNQEKADRLEYGQVISTFFAQAMPILQAGGMNKESFREMLSFISKPFKVGRNLEEYLLSEEEEEPQGPTMEEQLAQADNARKDQELQLKGQEVSIKQQLADVEKAKVKVSIEHFNDKLEFEDVNKEADRRAKTLEQVVQDGTQRASKRISESNLV